MTRAASTSETETVAPRKRAAKNEDRSGTAKRKAAPKSAAVTIQPRRGPREMSAEHKTALAEGRRESAAVRAYLDAWEMHRPKRGRKRTAESIQNRIAAIDTQMVSASAFEKLHLTQERLDLENEIANLESGVDLSALEDAFVEVAAAYGHRRGITYNSWRQIGLSPELLKRAGITRSN
jgi:hypothetical protein